MIDNLADHIDPGDVIKTKQLIAATAEVRSS